MNTREGAAVARAIEAALDRAESSGAAASISEMQYRQLFSAISSIARGLSGVSDEMASLFQHVSDAFEYRDACELSGFALGTCWGSLSLLHTIMDDKSDAVEDAEARTAGRCHPELLFAIFEQPGITHAELAEALGTSASNLTRIVSKLGKHRLIKTARETPGFIHGEESAAPMIQTQFMV